MELFSKDVYRELIEGNKLCKFNLFPLGLNRNAGAQAKGWGTNRQEGVATNARA